MVLVMAFCLGQLGALAVEYGRLCQDEAAAASGTPSVPCGQPDTWTKDEATAAPADGNWGLGFPGEGQKPVGNADAAYLKQFNAFYVGDTPEKIIYLTFDAGYENGHTAAILAALKTVSYTHLASLGNHLLNRIPVLLWLKLLVLCHIISGVSPLIARPAPVRGGGGIRLR